LASYYYLIASLPMLKVGEDPPLSYSDFLGMCESTVSESTYNILENLSVFSSEGPLLKQWATFYEMLTAELNYRRNQKLDRPATAPSGTDADIAEAVSRALDAEDPLKSEHILLRFEFKRLDDMIGLHNFDDTALYGYAIKLKLLERQSTFRYEAGKQAFEGLMEQLQEQIFNI